MGDISCVIAPRSAYLHIPFCYKRCFYCDFAVVPLGDKARGDIGPGSTSIKSYLHLLHREISLSPKGPPLSTVYIGGGTPSLLTSDQISSLLSHLDVRFGFQYGAEITLEIDPGSFNLIDLEGYLEAGINRFSLGGQSFDDKVLAQLGRSHSRQELLEACYWLDAFFKSGHLMTWSLDLIQNLPSHDLPGWEKQLIQAVGTSAPHLSIYDLSIEPGTVFEWRARRGQLQLPDEDLAADAIRTTSSILGASGFSRYEISNYALPGHASRHNRVYWSGAGWWGFGQGATSAPWGERLTRPRTRDTYQRWIEKQEIKGVDPSLVFQTAMRMSLDDQIMVGLRRREGVDLMLLAQRWGWNQNESERNLSALKLFWTEALEQGWLIQQGWRFRLCDPEGMEISNQIIIQMFLWWDSLPVDAVLGSKSVEHRYKVRDQQVMAD